MKRTLEEIPNHIKPLINSYIVMGKRILIQETSLANLRTKSIEALQNLTDVIVGISTKHFHFQREYPEQVKLYFHASPSDPNFSTGLNLMTFPIAFVSRYSFYSYDEAFSIPTIYVKEHLKGFSPEDIRKLQDEYKDLLIRVKKATAFLYFEAVHQGEKHNRFEAGLHAKERRHWTLRNTIIEEWSKTHLPQVGQKVFFRDKKTFARAQGEIIAIFPDRKEAKIRTIKNGTVYRHYEAISYPGKYADTYLKELLEILTYKVPECWKQKTLTFYS